MLQMNLSYCAVNSGQLCDTPPRCRPERVQLLKAGLAPYVLLSLCVPTKQGVHVSPFQEFFRNFCSDEEFLTKRRRLLQKSAGLGEEDPTKLWS